MAPFVRPNSMHCWVCQVATGRPYFALSKVTALNKTKRILLKSIKSRGGHSTPPQRPASLPPSLRPSLCTQSNLPTESPLDAWEENEGRNTLAIDVGLLLSAPLSAPSLNQRCGSRNLLLKPPTTPSHSSFCFSDSAPLSFSCFYTTPHHLPFSLHIYELSYSVLTWVATVMQ